jgi:D-erythronate 2-dehydrogenase
MVRENQSYRLTTRRPIIGSKGQGFRAGNLVSEADPPARRNTLCDCVLRTLREVASSMHILITGAAGMIGRKLITRLIRDGALAGRAIDRMTLTDIVAPETPAGARFAVVAEASDLAVAAAAARAVADRPDVIFHLAAIVSGEAEADFEKGYQVNLGGTRELFEAIRLAGDGYRPKLVFASSIAVFGAPFPQAIGDDFFLAPLTSYGTQKAIGELLLGDYTRRGFLDGIGIRLPTIVVRPGKPNQAASGFFSSIIREPLAGREAVLPVSEDVRHWFASPRAAVEFLLHAAGLAADRLGPRINLTMPGLTATVGEEIAALARVAGADVVRRIRREPDAAIAKIVAGWPQNFDARRATTLGFRAETSFDEIIRTHIDDELGGRIGP